MGEWWHIAFGNQMWQSNDDAVDRIERLLLSTINIVERDKRLVVLVVSTTKRDRIFCDNVDNQCIVELCCIWL